MQPPRSPALSSLDQLLSEANRLAAAERAESLVAHGNWTLGQTFGHLAAWMDFAYDGYPAGLNPPFFLKVICRVFKSAVLKRPLPRGFKFSGVPGGTYAIEQMPTDAGLTKLRASVARLASTPPTKPNPLFGAVSHQQLIAMHLAHANLHLGFFTTSE